MKCPAHHSRVRGTGRPLSLFEPYHHELNIATLRFWIAFVDAERLTDSQRAQFDAKRRAGEASLKLRDEHLAERSFFVGERLTLADIALYAYTHVAEEGGFELPRYPAVQQWLDRVAAVPGYIGITA